MQNQEKKQDLNQQIEQIKIEFKLMWGTRREVLFAFIIGTAAVLFGWFFTYAEYDRMAVLDENRIDAQSRVENSETLRSNWQRALNSPEFQDYVEIVHTTLPSFKPVLENLFAFNQLGINHPVSISRFDFAPGTLATSGAVVVAEGTPARRRANRSPTSDFIMINLNAVGQFDDLMLFLINMQEMMPIGNIFNARIGKSETGASSVRLSFLSYYFDQETQVSATLNLPQLDMFDRKNLASISAYTPLLDTGRDLRGLAGGLNPELFVNIRGLEGRTPELIDVLEIQLNRETEELGIEPDDINIDLTDHLNQAFPGFGGGIFGL